MENTKYGKRREGRLTPIRAKAQDTKANPNSWETDLVRKRWDIGLLRALSLRIIIMMMMMMIIIIMNILKNLHIAPDKLHECSTITEVISHRVLQKLLPTISFKRLLSLEICSQTQKISTVDVKPIC